MNNFEQVYFNIILEESGKNFLKKEIKGDIKTEILTDDENIKNLFENIKIKEIKGSTLDAVLKLIGTRMKVVGQKLNKDEKKKDKKDDDKNAESDEKKTEGTEKTDVEVTSTDENKKEEAADQQETKSSNENETT